MQIQQTYTLLFSIFIFSLPFLVNLYYKRKGLKRVLYNYLKTFSVVGLTLSLFISFITELEIIQFNSKFLTGTNVIGLPIEVFLLMFSIPFATIALYEFILEMFKDKRIVLDKSLFYLFALTYFVLALIFGNYIYTSTVLFLNSILFFVASYLNNSNVFLTKNFYVFNLMLIIGFILVSIVLTTLPIISYNTQAITGFKIGTIPFEEFFMSFFVISIFLIVYFLVKNSKRQN